MGDGGEQVGPLNRPPSTRRSRVTYVCTARRASPGSASSHAAMASRSTETVSPAETASTASNVRNRGADTTTGRPSTKTPNGPSNPTQSPPAATPRS